MGLRNFTKKTRLKFLSEFCKNKNCETCKYKDKDDICILKHLVKCEEIAIDLDRKKQIAKQYSKYR